AAGAPRGHGRPAAPGRRGSGRGPCRNVRSVGLVVAHGAQRELPRLGLEQHPDPLLHPRAPLREDAHEGGGPPQPPPRPPARQPALLEALHDPLELAERVLEAPRGPVVAGGVAHRVSFTFPDPRPAPAPGRARRGAPRCRRGGASPRPSPPGPPRRGGARSRSRVGARRAARGRPAGSPPARGGRGRGARRPRARRAGAAPSRPRAPSPRARPAPGPAPPEPPPTAPAPRP